MAYFDAASGRAAAPERARGPAGGAGRGLGRPGPAAPRGPAGPAAARPGQGGRRDRAWLPPRRAVLHQLGYAGGAPRGRSAQSQARQSAAPRSRPPGRQRGRALQRAQRSRLAGTGHRYAGQHHRRRRPGPRRRRRVRRGRAAGPDPARLPPVGQPRGRHRSSRSRMSRPSASVAGVPLLVDAGASAGRMPLPAAGRC